MMPPPLLTVITPVFNGASQIDACIDNVAAQECSRIEHIIVDGGSTDGTVDRIEARAAALPYLSYVSERDRGQSDAMNKGLALARADYVSFLNVDDYYAPGVLTRMTGIIACLTAPSFVSANCNVIDENDAVIYVNRPRALQSRHLSVGRFAYPFPMNPSAYFYHKSVHGKIGGYDLDEHFTLDLKFILKAVRVLETRFIDEVWGNYRYLPGTKTFEHVRSGRQRAAAREAYLENFRTLPVPLKMSVAARFLFYLAFHQVKAVRRARG